MDNIIKHEFRQPPVLYTCNFCGKEQEWGESWSWRFIIYIANPRERGYEEQYKTCSEKCQEWAENNIKWTVRI